MIVISHYRSKCIGCNSCVELAGDHWTMSHRDGKSVLIQGREKRGVYTLKTDDEGLDKNLLAAEACPVNIIKVNKV